MAQDTITDIYALALDAVRRAQQEIADGRDVPLRMLATKYLRDANGGGIRELLPAVDRAIERAQHDNLTEPERAALAAWGRSAGHAAGMLGAVRAALTVAGCPRCREHGVPARVADCGPACHEAHTFIAPCSRAPEGS